MESCRVLKAMVCRLSNESQVFKSADTPFEVAGRIRPKVFFFQPNSRPVSETIRKKANKTMAICR